MLYLGSNLLTGCRFVAMHSMQPAPTSNVQDMQIRKTEVFYTTLGILLPLITQIGHSHAHGH